MGNVIGIIVCGILSGFTLNLIDFQECVDGFNPTAPTTAPVPAPTSMPVDAPTPMPVAPDTECDSTKRVVTVASNGFTSTDVTINVSCLSGATIRLLNGVCQTVEDSTSNLQCAGSTVSPVEVCCDEPGSTLFVFGQLLSNLPSDQLILSAYASSDAQSVERLGQCTASNGAGEFYTLCTMTTSTATTGSVQFAF